MKFLILEIVLSSWALYNIFVDSLLLCNFLSLQRYLLDQIQGYYLGKESTHFFFRKRDNSFTVPVPFLVVGE